MKILIASDLHYPTINGVATFSRNLAHGLAARGHEVRVVAPSQTGKHYKEVDGNYMIYRTTSVVFPFYQNFRISLSPSREVKRIIEEFQPDVIHIQMLMWIGQAVMHYGKKADIPIVSTNHAMPENLMDNLKLLSPLARPINYMLREYGRRFHSKSDCVTMPTQSAIEMFSATRKMTKPLIAVSNGVDLKHFTPGPVPQQIYQKFHIPEDAPIVSYVGRLDAEKHLSVLIKAFETVALEQPTARLVIVGSGTDAENLREQVDRAGLADRVIFTGLVSEEDKPFLHRLGTVFVMPSPAELQSIATLEAMASGQPVVAVDAGALKEICQDGRNGYLCAKDDAVAIANSIVRILADAKLRQRFSKASLAIAATQDIERTLDQFIAIYEGLVND